VGINELRRRTETISFARCRISSVFYSITTDGIPSLELDSALGIEPAL
jgi:hypothetical protein